MNWEYIEESEQSLENLGNMVEAIADDLDIETLDMMSMHFMLMKVSLVGLRGYAGDLVEDDIIGEKPVVVAETLQELGSVIGREGSPSGLARMFESSYSAILNVLNVIGKVPMTQAGEA